MTIVEFLTARLAEDQAASEAVEQERPWRAFAEDVEGWVGTGGHQGKSFSVGEHDEYPQDYPVALEIADGSEDRRRATAEHVVRHDPARVLAQVAAMRAIVELHESWPVLVETQPEMSTATDDIGDMTLKMAKQVAWLTEREYRQRFGTEPPTAPMLRHLAAIWCDHPDCDPTWAPDA